MILWWNKNKNNTEAAPSSSSSSMYKQMSNIKLSFSLRYIVCAQPKQNWSRCVRCVHFQSLQNSMQIWLRAHGVSGKQFSRNIHTLDSPPLLLLLWQLKLRKNVCARLIEIGCLFILFFFVVFFFAISHSFASFVFIWIHRTFVLYLAMGSPCLVLNS